MSWCRTLLFGLLLGCLLAGAPASLRACPMCAEAIPESSQVDEDGRIREAQAYNWSIYLMVSVPYLLFGGVSFLVYRGLKQRARAEQLAGTSSPRMWG